MTSDNPSWAAGLTVALGAMGLASEAVAASPPWWPSRARGAAFLPFVWSAPRTSDCAASVWRLSRRLPSASGRSRCPGAALAAGERRLVAARGGAPVGARRLPLAAKRLPRAGTEGAAVTPPKVLAASASPDNCRGGDGKHPLRMHSGPTSENESRRSIVTTHAPPKPRLCWSATLAFGTWRASASPHTRRRGPACCCRCLHCRRRVVAMVTSARTAEALLGTWAAGNRQPPLLPVPALTEAEAETSTGRACSAVLTLCKSLRSPSGKPPAVERKGLLDDQLHWPRAP